VGRIGRLLVMPFQPSRRRFLEASALTLGSRLFAQVPGDRPKQDASVKVLNPRNRVPVSIIIDDSTCLVNLNKFAIPQFAAANPGRYDHYPWKSWPDEIPDDFVRKFADWATENGVKGKYSIVPYPACVGRLDRQIPGWTQKELQGSIDLVRERIMPNWDIHHRYEDRSPVSGDQPEIHGELEMVRRAQRGRNRRLHELRAHDPQKHRPAVRGRHDAGRLWQRCAATARAGDLRGLSRRVSN
jgi:hypothetical protein